MRPGAPPLQPQAQACPTAAPPRQGLKGSGSPAPGPVEQTPGGGGGTGGCCPGHHGQDHTWCWFFGRCPPGGPPPCPRRGLFKAGWGSWDPSPPNGAGLATLRGLDQRGRPAQIPEGGALQAEEAVRWTGVGWGARIRLAPPTLDPRPAWWAQVGACSVPFGQDRGLVDTARLQGRWAGCSPWRGCDEREV